MMKARHIVLGSLCVGVLCATTGFAGDDEEKAPRKHCKDRGAAHFKAMDTDGDGSLSLAEFTVMHEAHQAKMKKRMGDRWTPERAAKMPSAETIFTKLDADESGAVTKEEMKQAWRRRLEKHRKGKGKGEGTCPVGAGAGACKKAAPDVSI